MVSQSDGTVSYYPMICKYELKKIFQKRSKERNGLALDKQSVDNKSVNKETVI